jgi:hypothetical protein
VDLILDIGPTKTFLPENSPATGNAHRQSRNIPVGYFELNVMPKSGEIWLLATASLSEQANREK